MDVTITLTTVGTDQGSLFDFYSDVDGFSSAFETNVALASLLSGYTTALAPNYTTVIRVCGQEASCTNCIDIVPIYTTTTTTTAPLLECEENLSSTGEGILEYTILLNSWGGDLVFDFNAYGGPDKLEIIHSDVKKATTGMSVDNDGPFDDLYGDPTIPSYSQTLSVDQFIGTAKGIVPNREAAILADLGDTYIANGQQLVWWRYSIDDYDKAPFAILRITGSVSTLWDITRLCAENTTTTTTTSTSSTTTTTTTAVPTTTTTTTLSGLEAGLISLTTDISDGCAILSVTEVIYIDTQVVNVLTSDDTVYTDAGGTTVFVGSGDYYKLRIDAVPATYYSARIDINGKVLLPVTTC